jgi:hypothetical protein
MNRSVLNTMLCTTVGVLAAVNATQLNAAVFSCTAQSGATAPTVIELYTSEGCDSCPPADRWLSKMIASAPENTIALSFHVDYWDYIGWKDAFAKPAYGARHSALVKSAAASGVYTPQVFVNGRDDRTWTAGQGPGARGASASAAFTAKAMWRGDELLLSSTMNELSASNATRASVARLRYAYVENGLITAVKAGENRGVTLKHDAVVRDHGVLAAKSDGSFVATARIPSTASRAQSTLHIIAENQAGQALAAVSMRCE